MSLLKLMNKDNPSNPITLEKDVNPLIQAHYPKLLFAVHAALAVVGVLSMKNRMKPLSIIFEASSGLGKTAVLQMLFPFGKDKEIENFIYRSDSFTPKSFVTHAANVSAKELEKIDMLPRLKNKVLVTKELAPIFRGRETELQEKFSMLISVLDGKGFTSDSGMRGSRGYKEAIIFNWLGATTPLPAATHRMMSQLGTRLLFFEVDVSEPTQEELIAYAERTNVGKAEVECNKAVNKFILDYFKRNPVGTIEPESIVFPRGLIEQVVRWASFLVKARSEIKYDKEFGEWEPIAAARPEGAYKVINYFKELAIGHALIHGRKEVTSSDLELVANVAISSVPGHLRPIIKELRKCDSVNSKEGERVCAKSRPTIRKYFRELELLGIVELKKGSVQTNDPDVVKLVEDYTWLKC